MDQDRNFADHVWFYDLQLELARTQPRQERLIGPTHFALLMIVIGLVSLVLATLDHHQDLKALQAQYMGKRRPLATVLAGLLHSSESWRY